MPQGRNLTHSVSASLLQLSHSCSSIRVELLQLLLELVAVGLAAAGQADDPGPQQACSNPLCLTGAT